MSLGKRIPYVRPLKGEQYTLNYLEESVLFFRHRPELASKYLLKSELSWYQNRTVRNIFKVPYSMMIWGRGTGKTYTIASTAILGALFYPNIKIGIFGPGKRQGDFIFDEVDVIYRNSPFVQSSTLRHSKRTMEMNELKFVNGSRIISVPTGDGSTIRGLRCNWLMLDEYAQFDPQIVKLVIRPFLAIQLGDRPNKLILSSSAFYKWNHLWEEYKKFRINEVKFPHLYYVSEYNFKDNLRDPNAPFKFDISLVQQAKENSTEAEFLMEWCFPPDQLIVLKDDLKYIGELNKNEYVVSHKGNNLLVNNTLERRYLGKVVKIKPYYQYESIKCTPNHPFFVYSDNEFKFKEAKDLSKNDYLTTPLLKENTNFNRNVKISDFGIKNYTIYKYKNKEYIYPNSSQTKNKNNDNKYDYYRKNNFPYKGAILNDFQINDDFCRLLGYYIAEGSLDKCRVGFSFHEDEEFYINDVINIVKRNFDINNNIEIVNHRDDKGVDVRITSRIFRDLIKYFIPGNCYTKQIPKIIFDLPNQLIKEFIVGYIRGDGCISYKSKNTCVVTSSSYFLIKQLKILLMMLGIQSSFNFSNGNNSEIGERTIKSNKSYILQIRGKFLKEFIGWFGNENYLSKINFPKFIKTPSFIKENYLLTKIKDINEIDYDGYVYNCSVNDDNSYLIQGFAVHNCGKFPDDVDTFFPMKLIDECTPKPPKEVVEIEFDSYERDSNNNKTGRNRDEYVMGVDVGRAEGGANFAIAICKYDKFSNIKTLVRMISRNGVRYQEMENLIRRCCIDYNIVRIHCDRGGGGETLRDLLSESWTDPTDGKIYKPILDLEDETTLNVDGFRYLKLVNFHGNKHANLFSALKSEMEHGRMFFPMNVLRHKDKRVERANLEIKALRNELAVIKPKPTGISLKFDVPAGGFRKDRAVALTLAVDAAQELHDPKWDTLEDNQLPVGFWV